MIIDTLHINWELGFHPGKDRLPEKWQRAGVPGAVQLDMLHTLDDPDWTRSDGYRQFRWMEDVWWTYRTWFDRPSLSGRERLFFRSRGIDYAFSVFLNGEELLQQEGMFRHVDLDLTEHMAEKNELKVVIAPVPKSHHDGDDHYQANHSFKPAVSYGWDWHPRLVPSGIWDETALEIRRDVLQNAHISYRLDESLKNASVLVKGRLLSGVQYLSIRVVFKGETVQSHEFECREREFRKSMPLENVKLWWPAGLGEPNLYDIRRDPLDFCRHQR